MRATLPEDVLVALKRRAEEALANGGAARTRLGYDVLVKMKMDELLDRECLSTPMLDDSHASGTVVAAASTHKEAGRTRPAEASGEPVMAELIANTFGGEPHGHHPGDRGAHPRAMDKRRGAYP